MKLGKCLKNSLEYIDNHPKDYLRLVQGPPGQKGDTSHFWVIDNDDKIIETTPEVVSKNYDYEGKIVDYKKVKEELNLQENIENWAQKINEQK